MNRRALLAAFGVLPFVPKVAAAVPAVAARPRVWPVSYGAFDIYPAWPFRAGEELTISGCYEVDPVTKLSTGALKRFTVQGIAA